jgi:hypothetical protein
MLAQLLVGLGWLESSEQDVISKPVSLRMLKAQAS